MLAGQGARRAAGKSWPSLALAPGLYPGIALCEDRRPLSTSTPGHAPFHLQVATRMSRLRRAFDAVAELPGMRVLAKPLYDRAFRRNASRNLFHGVYDSFAAAAAAVPPGAPVGYDNAASAALYRDRLSVNRVSDYPPMFWLSNLLRDGARRVFDLGGHIGVGYYAFQRFVEYPPDLDWRVFDVPAVMAAGEEWAKTHDTAGKLRFAKSLEEASGADVLLAMGSLQYLDYTLPGLLRRLDQPPPNLVISQTPLHPSRSFFTINSIGTAFCPYRITSTPEFIRGLEDAGYQVRDHWQSMEKQIRIPLAREHSFDHYSGFCFVRK
jgi:putative methyltransferase (TIGR04325 family)